VEEQGKPNPKVVKKTEVLDSSDNEGLISLYKSLRYKKELST